MRILFDSKDEFYKSPFGTLPAGLPCRLRIKVPVSVEAQRVFCIASRDEDGLTQEFLLTKQSTQDSYDLFEGQMTLIDAGLYFYYFQIEKKNGFFRLFKHNHRDTNMEAGSSWQLTCTPPDFSVPQWAQGAVIYQVFPDRFHRSGSCDLTGKLQPYTLHEKWDEEVVWQPNERGEVLNNDFYGGNFRGITEKMDYIASLGTGILYLNPICKSFSSHRYDTGDYKTPDPMLGTLEEFKILCEEAHKRNIRVILDGVFSHTGADSLYFDKKGTFGGFGAYCRQSSPYYNWYTFHRWPDSYNCWWDFDTLPTVNKLHPDFLDYIIRDEDSVVAFWLKCGADGFRLDVADELPNEFMALLKKRVREVKPDALVLGEVWEDASNKLAYGVRRRYFTDGTLDSVMNYPFRTAILNYMRGADDGSALARTVETIQENYPRQVFLSNMNLLGTHDTARILTALVDDFNGSRAEKAQRSLSPAQLELAKKRLLSASFLQYMLPGSPSLYYGDEALMEGHNDPFNRRTYPWGKEDQELLEHFRRLGQLRKDLSALRQGNIDFFCAGDGCLAFTRAAEDQKIQIYVNQSDKPRQILPGQVLYSHLLTGTTLSPGGFCVVM